MAGIEIDHVSKSYGDFLAVDDVSLTIEDGEFVTLLGASGSGKTTCLRLIAGFVEPTAGRIRFGDRDVTRLPPYRRDTGMVFQQYALFPHLSIADNVAYGLRVRRVPRADIDARVREALRLVRMEHLAERRPGEISGGQKQRVALARAVVIRPQVLLLDEPLAALDLKLREELQVEIKRVQQAVGITTVFVTHDQGEAFSLSDRVAVMAAGRIVQIDTPTALYESPSSRFVANFIGQMNFIDAVLEQLDSAQGGLTASVRTTEGQRLSAARVQEGPQEVGAKCVLAFRPEDARFGDTRFNHSPATVSKVLYVGNCWTVSCTGPRGENLTVLVGRNDRVPAIGDRVIVGWAPADSLLLTENE